MRQRTAVGVDSRVPALDLLNSSQRVSRSGSARLGPQKGGLPIHCGSSYYRFKAIDARLRGSFPRLPLNSVARVKKSPTEAGLECQRRSAAGPPLRQKRRALVFFVWNVVTQSEGAGGLSLQPPPEGCASKGGLLKRVGAISSPAGRQHRP